MAAIGGTIGVLFSVPLRRGRALMDRQSQETFNIESESLMMY